MTLDPFNDALFASHAATALKLRESGAPERRRKLAALLDAILERRDVILDAAQADLGRHPAETNIIELLPLIGEVTTRLLAILPVRSNSSSSRSSCSCVTPHSTSFCSVAL